MRRGLILCLTLLVVLAGVGPSGVAFASGATSGVTTAMAGSTTVEVVPSETELTEGDSRTLDIVVTNADGGVGAMTARLTVESEAARIESAALRGDPGVENVTVTDDGSTVILEGALLDTSDDGRVTVGEVTVTGTAPGQATAALSVSALGDETGTPYDVGATLGSVVSVTSATNAVDLTVTANQSQITPGQGVAFTVSRADSDVRVAGTVTVGSQTVRTGVDGVARVAVTEAMVSDAGTVTAVASKAATSDTEFVNDTTTVPVSNDTTADDTSVNGTATTVRFTPTTGTTPVGETATFDLVVESADGGVGALATSVSVGDGAQITEITYPSDPGVENTTIAENGSRASLSVALLDTADTGRVTVAEVTVAGDTRGEIPIRVTPSALADERGTAYTVAASPASTLSVGTGSDTGTNSTEDMTSNSTDDTGSVSTTDASTVTVSLASLPNGFQEGAIRVETAAPATATTVSPQLVSGSQARVVEQASTSTVTQVQMVDLTGNVGPTTDERELLGVTFDRSVERQDLNVTVLLLRDDDDNAIATDNVSVTVTDVASFSGPLPGASTERAPRDPDGDQQYEDIDGDGEVTFDDAVALTFVRSSGLTTAQVAAIDFDDDGKVTIDDAIALAFET